MEEYSFYEKMIRNLFVDCIKDQSSDYDVKATDVQLRFYPLLNNGDIECRYHLLLDYTFKKELSFVDISGLLKSAFQGIVEHYIAVLYTMINESEGIDLKDIRLIILSTNDEPAKHTIKAFLYNKGTLIRELNVSEFVKQGDEE